MATALASARSCKIPVRRDVAMTGEITLRGRVLPIGGLKEKILAAHRAGITTVSSRRRTGRTCARSRSRVLKAMRIVLVEHMDEVLREALVLEKPEEFLPRPERVGRLAHERRPSREPSREPRRERRRSRRRSPTTHRWPTARPRGQIRGPPARRIPRALAALSC